MFLKRISNSKRDTFKSCKLKYKYRYSDKIYSEHFTHDSMSFAMQYGSFIHKVFQDGVDLKELSELQALAEETRSQYKFGKKQGKDTEVCLKNFLRLNSSLEETLGCEVDFNIDIGSEIEFTGIMDRVIIGKTGKILVLDYKTSRFEKTKAQLWKDPQMLGYCYAAHKLYKKPVNEITVGHYYPKSDTLVTIKYTRQQIDTFLRGLVEDCWKIRKAKKIDLVPQENEFCNWCSFYNLCPKQNPVSWKQQLTEAIESKKKT